MSLFSKLFKCQVKNELPVVNSKENEIEKVSPAIELSGAEKIKEVGNFIVNSPIVVQNRNMHIDLLEDNDIVNVLNLIKSQNKPDYIDMSKYIKKMNEQISYDVYNDSLYDDIVEFVISTQKVSASLLQRKFKLGYNRAARIIDLLEERGIIGPSNGSKPREVLVKLEENVDSQQ